MNCSGYEMKIETRSCSPHSPCRCVCYEDNCINKEKDMLISQLKAHIFELELREKDYNILNERYCQLQHDIAQLNDCKLQLECELKLQDEKINSNICALQGENKNLQLNFNEKLSSNKTIFSENNALGKEIEQKDAEICQLKLKCNDLMNKKQINDGKEIICKKLPKD